MSTINQRYRVIAAALKLAESGRTALDGCGSGQQKTALDSATINAAAATYAQQNIRVQAASAVQVWADTESAPLGQGEGASDRLVAMLVGIADADQSGELDEEEHAVYLEAAEAAWAYMAGLGASEEDLDALFNGDDPDEANAAGERIIALLVDALPSGESDSRFDMDDFAFGDPDVTMAALDATYTKKVAFRGGKKVMVRKRISGSVHQTAAQRLAVRKMQAKSHSASANMARKKSVKARRSAGM